MPRPQHAGPPQHAIERLLHVHQNNGTLDRLADSGIGDLLAPPENPFRIVLEDGMHITGASGQDGLSAWETTDGVPTDGGYGEAAVIVEDTFTLVDIVSTGDEANAILGGDGGDGGRPATKMEPGGLGGEGAHAIENSGVGSVRITGDADLSVLGGTDGWGGGLRSKSDTRDVASAFSSAVEIDATGFGAHLTISGSDFDDVVAVGSGGATLFATSGADTYMLGSGRDVVAYAEIGQSTADASDRILGFDASQDIIDLSALSRTKAGYGWIGDGEFVATSKYVQARLRDSETIEVDADRDGEADLTISIVGADLLTADNFVF